MTNSISSLFQAGLFRKYDFLVSQFKTFKTTSLKISKMWSTIFSLSKLGHENYLCTLCHLSVIGNKRRYSIRLSIPMFNALENRVGGQQ